MRIMVVAGLALAMPDGTLSFMRQQSSQAAQEGLPLIRGKIAGEDSQKGAGSSLKNCSTSFRLTVLRAGGRALRIVLP
jgi:hypothetical protein